VAWCAGGGRRDVRRAAELAEPRHAARHPQWSSGSSWPACCWATRCATRAPIPPVESEPRGRAALQAARRQGDLAPLRRVEPLLLLVLGPSMAYTCAVYRPPRPPWRRRSAPSTSWWPASSARARHAAADVGCGCGRHVMHAARRARDEALGVTLSRKQAEWAQKEIRREWPDRAGRGCATWTTGMCRSPASTDLLDRADRAHRRGLSCRPTRRALRQTQAGRAAAQTTASPSDRDGPLYVDQFIDRYVSRTASCTAIGKLVTEMNRRASRSAHE